MYSCVRIGCVSLVALALVACSTSSATPSSPSATSVPQNATAVAPSSPATSVPQGATTVAPSQSKLIEPGDTVGDVTLVAMSPAPTQYINGMVETCPVDSVNKPGVYDFKCPNYLAPMRWLGIGLSNSTAELVKNDWSHIQWKVYLDGQEIDLKNFGTFDLTLDNAYQRGWNIAIKDPTPREYAIRVVFEVAQGLTDTPAGTYDITTRVTLVKRAQ